MKEIFADTFYWIALTNPEDSHSAAVQRFDDFLSAGYITTTEEVLTELLRNTRKTGTVSSAPPEAPVCSFAPWRCAAAPFALLTFFAGDNWLRNRAVQTVQEILSDDAVRLIPQSHGSLLSGFDLYSSRPDKGYSLTDCVSMQTMRREGLTDILTNDKHFEQEGFRALFRATP